MKRQRASSDVEHSVRELRDGKPLSEDTARRAREVAGYWMDQDAYQLITRGNFTPAPEEASNG